MLPLQSLLSHHDQIYHRILISTGNLSGKVFKNEVGTLLCVNGHGVVWGGVPGSAEKWWQMNVSHAKSIPRLSDLDYAAFHVAGGYCLYLQPGTAFTLPFRGWMVFKSLSETMAIRAVFASKVVGFDIAMPRFRVDIADPVTGTMGYRQ